MILKTWRDCSWRERTPVMLKGFPLFTNETRCSSGRMDGSSLELQRFNTFMPNYLLTGPDLSPENNVRQYVTATWRLPRHDW